MNNGLISDLEHEEEPIDSRIVAEEARLVRIIEALQEVQNTKAWSSLKTEVLDNLVNVLEKDLKTEARRDVLDVPKINKLNGELKWAERFADLSKLEQSYRTQLQGIRKHYGKNTE